MRTHLCFDYMHYEISIHVETMPMHANITIMCESIYLYANLTVYMLHIYVCESKYRLFSCSFSMSICMYIWSIM